MKIECPDCAQEFDVADDFIGKKVECGSCDHQFTIGDEHVIAEKERFYPGEKKSMDLGKFGKKASGGRGEVAFTPASYQSDVNPDMVGPPRPRKTLAIFGGLALMGLVIIIFLLGGGKEGPLRDIETNNRYVLCGFSALLGSILVIYGSDKNRWLGVMLALILSVILMFIPTMFPGNPVSSFIKPMDVSLTPVTESKSVIEPESMSDYLIRIGYDPIEEALFTHPRETVVGIYVRNADYSTQSKIASYLYYATGRVSREVVFPRGDTGQAAMILLVEQKKSIEQIATLCERFGQVVKMEKDLRLIEVFTDSAKMTEVNEVQLKDPEDPDFEFLNLKSLKHFDPEWQLAAAKRLAGAKPGELRADITEQFVDMLPVSHPELQLEIIRALKVWAEPESDIGEAVLNAAKNLHAEGRVSKVCMELLIDRQVAGCELILMELWNKDPVLWADHFIKLGAGAELMLLPQITKMDTGHLSMASEILGKVGTKECGNYLKGIMENSELDAKKIKSLQAAIDEIKKRS